ncbi:PREDICTED: transcription factor bHLH113 isoform X1 [Lupinus angustifolius]|uniref:transcription factor bHLH113 isoform X1 n=1 Tax=Lupinus angustifolius TaxID=3871 RepID=UPI00092E268B|nr:PREDICTED: transcription factor bHLH113 isoform X1 [Lupinus angustifolius]
MEAKHEFGVDHHLKNTTTITGTSFSQLLLADDDNEDDNALGLGVDQTYNNNNTNLTDYSPIFPIHIAPQMLCFGNYQNEEDLTNVLTPQKSVITNSSDSSSASSCNNTTIFNSFSKPDLKSLQKKRNGSGQEPVTKAGVGSQRPPKKTKADNPTSTGHAKRKEKLGERIAALQQLVSPFGKTDTASVLHEAMGYIKFLQDQVQVLCSPYLQRLPYSHHQLGDGDNNGEEVTKDLRSRGLCLIPMECTVHVASSNGADFWSPAAIGNNISPSTTMQ